MKRITVIFLLLQIVSNNAFAEELIKLPNLIKHYYHHTEEHGNTGGFFGFLQEHYSNHSEDPHADCEHDEDKDCNLPFKHCDGCCMNLHSPIMGFVSHNYLSIDYNFHPVKKNIFPLVNDRMESLEVCSIWQPPKIS